MKCRRSRRAGGDRRRGGVPGRAGPAGRAHGAWGCGDYHATPCGGWGVKARERSSGARTCCLGDAGMWRAAPGGFDGAVPRCKGFRLRLHHRGAGGAGGRRVRIVHEVLAPDSRFRRGRVRRLSGRLTVHGSCRGTRDGARNRPVPLGMGFCRISRERGQAGLIRMVLGGLPLTAGPAGRRCAVWGRDEHATEMGGVKRPGKNGALPGAPAD